jgi:hypothetical protein
MRIHPATHSSSFSEETLLSQQQKNQLLKIRRLTMVLAFGIGVSVCVIKHKWGIAPAIVVASTHLFCLAQLNLALRERALSS